MIGLAGAILTGLMFIDPEAGFELSGYSIITLVAPVVVLFSIPAVYFGFKSWPEVSAVPSGATTFFMPACQSAMRSM